MDAFEWELVRWCMLDPSLNILYPFRRSDFESYMGKYAELNILRKYLKDGIPSDDLMKMLGKYDDTISTSNLMGVVEFYDGATLTEHTIFGGYCVEREYIGTLMFLAMMTTHGISCQLSRSMVFRKILNKRLEMYAPRLKFDAFNIISILRDLYTLKS